MLRNFCNFKTKVLNKFFKILKKRGGRNSTGRITVKGRGGSRYKRKGLAVDVKFFFYNIPFIIIKKYRIYSRNNYINLVLYANGFLGFYPATEGIKAGTILVMSNLSDFRAKGMISVLRRLPLGSIFHNCEKFMGLGSVFNKSAGTKGQIISKFNTYSNYILIRLNSKAEYLLNCNCIGITGVAGNSKAFLEKFKKAGDLRNLGQRPHVRGVAMNPVDHPHGGGEGKTSGGRCSISWSGVLAKGFRTRKKRKNLFPIWKK